jgi:prophage maintenance system killer protein
MILSVGYRVNSAKATDFRKWANSVLKDYIIEGISINNYRLSQLNKMVDIISRSDIPELSGVSDILGQYTKGLSLLDEFDHQALRKPKGKVDSYVLKYNEALSLVNSMRFAEDSALFGQEKDNSFESALGAIYQTIDAKDVYPSVQEKAANLLYLTVKNHAFIDGNKRIAAALFVYFLDKNNVLTDTDGRLLISNNVLAAITLMIALSRPEEKDAMCLLVMNMLNVDLIYEEDE